MNALLPFREPLLSDAPMVQRSTINALQSDLAFANLYLLRHKYNTEILFHMEHLIRHFGSERLNGYSFPIGGSCSTLNECIHAIEQDAAARKRPHSYCLLTAEQALYLQRIYGERIRFTCNNGDADYLYKRSNLAELPGTAYHKKRTHAAKFSRLHPDAEFRKLSNENKEDVLYIAKHWLTAQPCTPALTHEFNAISTAIENMDTFQLTGGIAYIQAKPVGFCLATRMNAGVTDIHYEKCLPEYRDAYVYINHSFAQQADTEWINREEDLNIPGLRQAKLSYHPALILTKLSATIC